MAGDERKSFRGISRGEYFPSNLTEEGVAIGSFQRMADATEKMAVNITDLLKSRDRYKEAYEHKKQECEKLER
jgi:hypothetical protein